MKAYEILGYEPVNSTKSDKVNDIAESIKNNGWIGCPILTWGNTLVTGSHRLAALNKLDNEGIDISNLDCAVDVTELIDEAIAKFEKENEYIPDIDYSSIGWLFEGTWVEKYKNEIAEW